MIGVYSTDEIAFDRIARELPEHALVRWMGHESEIPMLDALACLLVVARRLPEAPTPRVLDWLCHRQSRTPWVLVTEFNRRNASELLSRGIVEHIVWWSELEATLRPLIRHLTEQDPLTGLAKKIEHNIEIPEPLRSTLVSALRSYPPPRTVRRLAHTAGVGEEGLRRQWRSSIGQRGRLKEFVDTLTLIYALRLRSELGSWASVAATLGRKEATLHNLARRLTGQTLGGLYAAGRLPCQRQVLAPWMSLLGR